MKDTSVASVRIIVTVIVMSLLLGTAVMAQASGPRLGRYSILSFGGVGNAPLYLGHFELLAGGKYRASNTSKEVYYGEGTYSFDPGSSTVTWLTGPFRDNGWTGEFTVEREGKTHRIRLARTTSGTNSTDSP